MDEKFLEKLLSKPKEEDWLEFKERMKLYQSEGKLVEQQRDELIKDILGLANGNSHTIRKTKYLIFGPADKKIDEKGVRSVHDVDYKVPSQSEIAKWLKGACSPAIVGLECDLTPYHGSNLFIITIPPTFDLHETTRDLITPNGVFHEHTVFMRQDEHTILASIRDALSIQQLKHLHRQEIANPSALCIGAITGGIIALIIGGAKIKTGGISLPVSESMTQIIYVVVGVFYGIFIGWILKVYNETRYDWRYLTGKLRITLIIIICISVALYYFVFLK